MALPVVGSVVKLKARKDGYFTSYGGNRWIVKNPTPGTGIAGGTSLSRTAPLLAIVQTGSSTTFPLVLSTLTVSQVGTVAGGDITLLVAIDSTNRYSAGGSALTAQRMNSSAVTTAGFTAYSGPTLTADGATDWDVYEFTLAEGLGTVTAIDFDDAVRISDTGTIMVYAFAATTAPTLTFCAEIIEGREED